MDYMWRKCYPSMYEGSMLGSGAKVFALWGYVITKQEPDKEFGSKVRLNPKLLAVIIGEPESEIISAIEYLCQPDPDSNTKSHGGRRLIRIAEFDYQVVNGEKYMDIRSTEKRKEQLKEAQKRHRQKKKLSSGPLPGEREASRTDTQEEFDNKVTEHLPDELQERPPKYLTNPIPITQPPV